jgi:hypothetical protein
MGRGGVVKQTGKMSQCGHFVTIQVKWVDILPQLHYIEPWGWVDEKSLDILPGVEMSHSGCSET